MRNCLGGLPPCLTIDTNFFRHSFAALFRVYDSQTGVRRTLAMTSYLMHLVSALMDISQEKLSASLSDRIAVLAKEMRGQPEASYDIDTLARRAALSPAHLITQFKRLTGLPPHQFLLSCRIEKAKRLLSNSETAIAEIALSLGFCSQQHFTTHFKRTTTQTPLAWRRRYGGG